MQIKSEHNLILLFDGYCNLCHSAVQFVIKHEKKQTIKFASLQSEIGKQLLSQYSINPNKIDSLVFIENGKCYIKSTAALRLLKYLKGLYPLGIVCIIIPTFIRNYIYDYVAKNRYKWFGKKESCWVPTPELKSKFLD